MNYWARLLARLGQCYVLGCSANGVPVSWILTIDWNLYIVGTTQKYWLPVDYWALTITYCQTQVPELEACLV